MVINLLLPEEQKFYPIRIKVKVTTEPGETFLDKMIALVEGASRQKTPNEIALTILLAGFTLDLYHCLCNTETIW